MNMVNDGEMFTDRYRSLINSMNCTYCLQVSIYMDDICITTICTLYSKLDNGIQSVTNDRFPAVKIRLQWVVRKNASIYMYASIFVENLPLYFKCRKGIRQLCLWSDLPHVKEIVQTRWKYKIQFWLLPVYMLSWLSLFADKMKLISLRLFPLHVLSDNWLFPVKYNGLINKKIKN